MLKFLVDESTGRKLVSSLREKGYDTEYISEDLLGADDEIVLEEALKDDRILITNDKDFGEIVFRRKKHSKGVILLRLNIDNPENRLKLLLYVIEKLGVELSGKFLVISEAGIRMRKID
ncbi:DUF5615 family PIN-like protein [Candidatus Woesearchaeota archaeon]|nr:DUF5615 family PIN-like protein [Candidatus Woesearchaeota archaeon]